MIRYDYCRYVQEKLVGLYLFHTHTRRYGQFFFFASNISNAAGWRQELQKLGGATVSCLSQLFE